MSKSELHNWECDIERLSGDNAKEMLKIAQDIYNTAYIRGKAKEQTDTAEWIKSDSDENCYCSKCHGYWLECFAKVMLYCPNCGAKMKGVD